MQESLHGDHKPLSPPIISNRVRSYENLSPGYKLTGLPNISWRWEMMADTSGPRPVPWGTKTGWFLVHLVFICSLQVSRMFMWWSSSVLASSWPSCSGMASVALASTSWSQLFPCSGPLWCKASSTACMKARSTLAWRGKSTTGMSTSVRFRCPSQQSSFFLSFFSQHDQCGFLHRFRTHFLWSSSG